MSHFVVEAQHLCSPNFSFSLKKKISPYHDCLLSVASQSIGIHLYPCPNLLFPISLPSDSFSPVKRQICCINSQLIVATIVVVRSHHTNVRQESGKGGRSPKVTCKYELCLDLFTSFSNSALSPTPSVFLREKFFSRS